MNYNYVVIMMQFSHFLLIKDIWDLPLRAFRRERECISPSRLAEFHPEMDS